MSPLTDRSTVFTKKYFPFLILFPIIFWAFAFPFIKIGLEELNPINLTIMRLFTSVRYFSPYNIAYPKEIFSTS